MGKIRQVDAAHELHKDHDTGASEPRLQGSVEEIKIVDFLIVDEEIINVDDNHEHQASNDFRDIITDRGKQVAEQDNMGGLVALQNHSVGTVVADQMFPTHFDVLKQALQALCKAKNCNFESLPREWWEHEVKENGKGFVQLIDHVLKQDYFNISNSSVHLGWSVSPPMIVCIKKFPDRMKDADVQIEISILKQVAQNSDTSTNNVIGFVGTDVDRKGGTVLIFEMIDASSFNSDLQTMTIEQIAEYMYRLMQALNYMHTRNIVHRDVKQENFLHNFQENKFRLIDFGSAIHGIQGFDKKGGGTRGCRAPETLKGTTTQTAAVDVWGAGIILLSLITGKIDILSRQAQKIKGEICDATHLKEIGCIVGNLEMQKLHEDLQQQRKPCDEYGDGSRHENKTGWAAKAMQSVIPGRIDQIGVQRLDQALDLLSKMLNVRPSKRITSQEALNHPFLQSAVNRT